MFVNSPNLAYKNLVKLKDLNLKIIGLIKKQELLWNSKLKGYHDSERKKKLWEDIAQEVSLTVDETKVKWKTQRDLFRKELLRMKQKGMTFSRWRYFPYVWFLKALMPLDLVENIEGLDFYEKEYGTTFDIDPYEIELITEDGPSSWKKAKVDNDDNDNIEIETVKNEIFFEENYDIEGLEYEDNVYVDEDEEAVNSISVNQTIKSDQSATESPSKVVQQDSDYLFLMSLLPFIQKISNKNKLLARIRLMQILNSEKLNFPNSMTPGNLNMSVTYNENPELNNDYDYLFLISLLPFCGFVSSTRKLIVRTKMTEMLSNEDDISVKNST